MPEQLGAPSHRRTRVRLCLVLLSQSLVLTPVKGAPGACLVDAAHRQIGVTLYYDPGYVALPYPNGDVAPERGVCTDVVIRAYRRFGVDLQQLVHEDMRAAWPAYPKLWGLARPDRNIDHRRVPNLATFFRRHGEALSLSRDPAHYRAGDLVTWQLSSGLPHIGIVSARRSTAGIPLVIHNIGAGTVEEDVLFAYRLTGHYRYRPAALAANCNTADQSGALDQSIRSP